MQPLTTKKKTKKSKAVVDNTTSTSPELVATTSTKSKKKAKFNSDSISEFKAFTVTAGFPETESIKVEKPKSSIELVYEKIRNKDRLPSTKQ